MCWEELESVYISVQQIKDSRSLLDKNLKKAKEKIKQLELEITNLRQENEDLQQRIGDTRIFEPTPSIESEERSDGELFQAAPDISHLLGNAKRLENYMWIFFYFLVAYATSNHFKLLFKKTFQIMFQNFLEASILPFVFLSI